MQSDTRSDFHSSRTEFEQIWFKSKARGKLPKGEIMSCLCVPADAGSSIHGICFEIHLASSDYRTFGMLTANRRKIGSR